MVLFGENIPAPPPHAPLPVEDVPLKLTSELSAQTVWSAPALTEGGRVTVIVSVEVFVHEFASVPVTVYVVFVVGESISGFIVAPVLHTYALPPLAVSVTPLPEQTVVADAEIEIVGVGFTVTVTVEVLPAQPALSVTETE